MLTMSHQRELQADEHCLRVVSPEGLPGDEQSESRVGRISAAVRSMSQHSGLVTGVVQSRLNGLAADGLPRHRPVHTVPCEWKLPAHEHSLRVLSS